jgi:hypothetical protein
MRIFNGALSSPSSSLSSRCSVVVGPSASQPRPVVVVPVAPSLSSLSLLPPRLFPAHPYLHYEQLLAALVTGAESSSLPRAVLVVVASIVFEIFVIFVLRSRSSMAVSTRYPPCSGCLPYGYPAARASRHLVLEPNEPLTSHLDGERGWPGGTRRRCT